MVEKNKIIKTLNQRLTDMKKMLQNEMKTSSTGNNNNNIINNNHNKKPLYKVCSENGKVTTEDVNFIYLKHVIFKFLTSREVHTFITIIYN